MTMHRLKVLYAVPFLLALAWALPSSPGSLAVDMPHSYVGFEAKHMVIAKVKGQFEDFNASVYYDADHIENSWVKAEIQVVSVDTRNERRDNHLRTSDFFDMEHHPTITFESTKVEARDEHFVATGELTIRGVTKEVELEFEILGPVDGMQGEQRYAANAWLEIDRHDFGVSWNRTLDNGGVVVADKVKIDINMELMTPMMESGD
jgi:polyisoprenoid-binding protein YceI